MLDNVELALSGNVGPTNLSDVRPTISGDDGPTMLDDETITLGVHLILYLIITGVFMKQSQFFIYLDIES